MVNENYNGKFHAEEPAQSCVSAAEQLAVEEKEPRFSVVMTSDAFPDPEDVYAIWDETIDDYYASDDGTVHTFPARPAAQSFLRRLELQESK